MYSKLEILRSCAKLQGMTIISETSEGLWVKAGRQETLYNPMEIKSQALELVIKLRLEIQWTGRGARKKARVRAYGTSWGVEWHENLLLAICECAHRYHLGRIERDTNAQH